MRYTDKDKKEISVKEVQRFYKYKDKLTKLIINIQKELLKVEEELKGIEIVNEE